MIKRKNAVHRHIYPHILHNLVIEEHAEKLTRQRRRATKNAHAKVSYTNVIEWMVEQLFAEIHPSLRRYLKTKRKLEELTIEIPKKKQRRKKGD